MDFCFSSKHLIFFRYNLTNAEEPFFVIESLDTLTVADTIGDDRAYKAVIFAVNQKGRSPRIVLKDFIVGDSSPPNPGMHS